MQLKKEIALIDEYLIYLGKQNAYNEIAEHTRAVLQMQ